MNLTDFLKVSDKWKLNYQLKILFDSSKDINQNPHHYLLDDKKEIMIFVEANKIIK